jgi:excisionase family DNA binding protein
VVRHPQDRYAQQEMQTTDHDVVGDQAFFGTCDHFRYTRPDCRCRLSIVEEKPKGGGHAAGPRQEAAEGAFESGWLTTEDAAAALGVSPRTIRDYIRSGGLEAKSEGAGVLKRWLVSKNGVQAMLEKRRSLEEIPVDRRESAAGSPPAADGAADAASRESAAASLSAAEGTADTAGGESAAGLPPAADGAADDAEPTVAALQNLQYRLGYAEARLELTEQAAITLQAELDRLLEDLKRERKRADTERERFEESRYIADRLQGQEFEARQKAERRERERDRAQEEARRLRVELEAERGKGSRRVVIAVLLLILVVAVVGITAAVLWTSLV